MAFPIPQLAFDLCEDNDAGVRTLDIISDGGLVFPLPTADATTRIIGTDVVLTDAATEGFETLPFTEETCRHTENSNDNGNFDHIVEAIIPKDDAIKRNMFAKMGNKCEKYTVVYTDENGLVKIIPSMIFTRDYDSGAATTDQNAYTVRFTKTGSAAFVYQGAIPRHS